MTDNAPTFTSRLEALRVDLVRQADAVESIVDDVVESVFERDQSLARGIADRDEAVDREDVRIERVAVSLLAEALAEGASCGLAEREVRLIMTIVKANNEYERIADLAVDIAEHIESLLSLPDPMPRTFRVMANSVIGMVSGVNSAFDAMDAELARSVLASYDATTAFQGALMRDVEQRVASGANTVDYAFAAQMVAANLARMADHCTNIAEQVIYVASGKIVRHLPDGWSEPMEPNSGS